MTVAELQQAKAAGCPVTLKATPPKTYCDITYNRVLAVTMRKINDTFTPVAVLEDRCGRSITFAEPEHIVMEEKSA